MLLGLVIKFLLHYSKNDDKKNVFALLMDFCDDHQSCSIYLRSAQLLLQQTDKTLSVLTN